MVDLSNLLDQIIMLYYYVVSGKFLVRKRSLFNQ